MQEVKAGAVPSTIKKKVDVDLGIPGIFKSSKIESNKVVEKRERESQVVSTLPTQKTTL